jgi:hypothetical protein
VKDRAVFEKWELKRIFVPKRDEAMGDWRKRIKKRFIICTLRQILGWLNQGGWNKKQNFGSTFCTTQRMQSKTSHFVRSSHSDAPSSRSKFWFILKDISWLWSMHPISWSGAAAPLTLPQIYASVYTRLWQVKYRAGMYNMYSPINGGTAVIFIPYYEGHFVGGGWLL